MSDFNQKPLYFLLLVFLASTLSLKSQQRRIIEKRQPFKNRVISTSLRGEITTDREVQRKKIAAELKGMLPAFKNENVSKFLPPAQNAYENGASVSKERNPVANKPGDNSGVNGTESPCITGDIEVNPTFINFFQEHGPFMAVDRYEKNRVLAGCMKAYDGNNGIRYYSSNNSGQNFQPEPPDYSYAQSHAAYDINGNILRVSNNEWSFWGNPFLIIDKNDYNTNSWYPVYTAGSSIYKDYFLSPYVCNDNLSTSPYASDAYVLYEFNYLTGSYYLPYAEFVYSNTAGASFDGPYSLTSNVSALPSAAINAEGDVFFCWVDFGTPAQFINNQSYNAIGFSRLLANGTQIDPPKILTEISPVTGIVNNTGGVRFRTRPRIVVDNSGGLYNGRVYLFYETNNNGVCRIAVTYSDNKGYSWSASKIISPITSSAASHNTGIGAAVDNTGRLYISFMGFQTGVTNTLLKPHLLYSDNGGLSFLEHEVTPFHFVPANSFTSGMHLLVSTDLSVIEGQVNIIWTDYRNGFWQLYAKSTRDHLVTGPDFLCGTGSYSIPNLPATSTVSWSVYPTGVVNILPIGNGHTVQATRIGPGAAWLTPTVTGYCQAGQPDNKKVVTRNEVTGNYYYQGSPATTYLAGSYNYVYSPAIELNVENNGGLGTSSYSWELVMGNVTYQTQNNNTKLLFDFGSYENTCLFKLTVNSDCGADEYFYWFELLYYPRAGRDLVGKESGHDKIIISQNGYFDIRFLSTLLMPDEKVIKRINVFDPAGRLVKRFADVNPLGALDLSALSKGSYVIQFVTEKQNYTKRYIR